MQVDETWAKSTWAKRMAVKAKRAGLTDLDRFVIALVLLLLLVMMNIYELFNHDNHVIISMIGLTQNYSTLI